MARLSRLAALAILAAVAAPVEPAASQEWGCYDPKPGHPTQQERLAFVEEVSTLALEAERQHGVPSPALAAMSIVESGYGFTRTALNANNLFGFKWTSSGCRGRPSWELACQPAWGPGKLYIKFATRADAVDFVASRLANSQYYAHDTQAFQLALHNGQDRKAAIAAWLEGIADPYNYDPARYVAAVSRLMNNPVSPSNSLDPETTLFRLDPAEPMQPTDAGAIIDLDDIADIVGRGRYMERPACSSGQTPAAAECCRQIGASDPLMSTPLAPYASFRLPAEGHYGLQECGYKDHGLRTRVIMLNPTPRRVAEWTVSACRKSKAKSIEDCAKWAWQTIFSRSGTQFAIAGAVVEPYNGVCWSGTATPGDHVGYTFRDGVTVRLEGTDGVCDVDADRLASDPSPYFTASVIRTTEGGPSRVTMMTRQDYQGFNGGELPGRTPENGTVPWLKLVRESHMAALGSTSHPWLDQLVNANLPASKRE